MKKLATSLTAGLLAAGFGLGAQAAPLTGGVTVVEVTADLEGLEVSGAPVGSATVEVNEAGNPVFGFPITGGDIDPASLAGMIMHDGSGLSLTNESGITVSLTNFVIDTAASMIMGMVTVSDGTDDTMIADAHIFDFDVSSLSSIDMLFDTEDPMLSLTLSSFAGDALEGFFGANLTGAEIGLAATAPVIGEAVPLPGAAVFFATGLAAYAARRRLAA
ncbi:PEP-CTERM sorting domain-containing protein [Parvularcula dongshanensis]|uniref:PEP-CTERM sorting domain-containing protein n=1 Tax=Parvularcula dongshanensis TaxID=1173995 RepID=A0A840I4K0_9PROT|nr:PEP-CTERM sorting domain-containing protein [Parvularcula dongshanensis]MBB4659134.1 hypothetical protein [Parvularcula dongshanensis]